MFRNELIDYALAYRSWYYVAVWVFTFIAILNANKTGKSFNKVFPLIFSIVVVAFITYRPHVWQVFGDTSAYALKFAWAQTRSFNNSEKDIGFEWSMQLLKPFTVTVFFLLYALLYVGPQYKSVKRLFPNYVAVGMVLIVGSFSFFGYGFNGIRNGAACALVMLALTESSLLRQLLLFLIGASIHKSVLLPICVYYIVKHYNKPDLYVKIWVVCLIVNIAIPNILGDMSWLSDILEDKRASSYLNANFDTLKDGLLPSAFSHHGFRYDFALFSVVPILIYLYNRHCNIKLPTTYSTLLNVYIICNAAWLFTARIPFNNRFAYLSWFLMPIILLGMFIINPNLRANTNLNLLLFGNLLLASII